MTLDEVVKQIYLRDGEYLHIGSASGFFFIGTKEEYGDMIEAINDKYIRLYRGMVRSSERALENRKLRRLYPELIKPTVDNVTDYLEQVKKIPDLDEKRKKT